MKMENLSQKQSTTNGGADGLTEMKEQFTELSNSVKSFKDRIESSAATIENIEEKMYDFEVGKKNNLIFYGIPAPRNETRHSLAKTIQDWCCKTIHRFHNRLYDHGEGPY